MAHTAFLPTEMSIGTAVAFVVVIVTVATSLAVVGWLFTRLTPSRRRDLVELVRALRQGSDRS